MLPPRSKKFPESWPTPITVVTTGECRSQGVCCWYHQRPCRCLASVLLLGTMCIPRVILPWMPCQSDWPLLPPGVMVQSGTRMLPETMSGSIVIPQLRPVLLSVAHDNTKGYTDARVRGQSLCPCWCLRAMLPLETFWSVWPALPHRTLVLSIPRLLHKAMSGSVPQWLPGSRLISVTSVSTKDCEDARDLYSYLRPCPCLEALLLPGSYWSGWLVLPPGPWWYPVMSCCQKPCLGKYFLCVFIILCARMLKMWCLFQSGYSLIMYIVFISKPHLYLIRRKE